MFHHRKKLFLNFLKSFDSSGIYFLIMNVHFVCRAVALPVATQCLVNDVKSDERITKFVLSLGVTLNNNGTAFFLAVSTVFIAQMTGVTLDFSSLAMILITVTACSMSMPSVPGGALLILLVVLTAVDIDPENVSLLFAIDWML